MSGLAIRFHRNGRPVTDAEVRLMLDAVSYRGPDGMWVQTWDNVGLGYAKMTITPEEVNERQPLVSPRTGCAIVADVRLDNRADLFSQLSTGLPTDTSDAELILRAYERWGTSAVEYLLGDFAFVIWDFRQQQIVCARDTSGQRPLYYRADRSTFVAASEIYQIVQDPSVRIAPNQEHILHFLTPQNMLRNEAQVGSTFYADIHSIPPGHILVADPDSIRLRKYWELNPTEIRYRSDDLYAEHFRELLFEGVRTRLRTKHKVGALLSGGLDSSTVVGVTQELYRTGGTADHGFETFSIVYDRLDCDERPYIETLQSKYNFTSHYIPAATFKGRLDVAPDGFRESPNGGIPEQRAAVYGSVQRANVRLLLSGNVADACVHGSPLVFDSLLKQGHFRTFYQHLASYRRSHDASWRRIIGLHILPPLLPMPLQKRLIMLQHQRLLRRTKHRALPNWMPEELRQTLAERYADVMLETERNRRFSNQSRQYDFNMLYPPAVAPQPAPWGVEVASPFADRRIHEFLLAIPPEQKYAPHPDSDEYYASSKQILRRAIQGIVPDKIRTRTNKTVFSGVYESELRQQWDLYRAIFGISNQSCVARHGYIEPAMFWQRLKQAHESPTGLDMSYVMQMIGLETWLRSVDSINAVRHTVSQSEISMCSENSAMQDAEEKCRGHVA